MTNAKLDDQFDEALGIVDMATARLKEVALKPSNIAWTFGIVGSVGYVFANALFMQSAAHPSVFFDTRTPTVSSSLKPDEVNLPVVQNAPQTNASNQDPVTRIVFDNQSSVNAAVANKPSPTVEKTSQEFPVAVTQKPANSEGENDLRELQNLLAQLGFYAGDVDGLDGPKTQAAIEAYKANVGLKGIELTSAELVTSAKNNLIVTAAVPKRRPQVQPALEIQSAIQTAPRPVETVSYKPPVVSTASKVDETVRKIQAGLRAFGDESISVDGVPGAQTTAAIQSFQALFRLPVTGEIDQQLIDKMRAVGLID